MGSFTSNTTPHPGTSRLWNATKQVKCDFDRTKPTDDITTILYITDQEQYTRM